MKIFTTEIRIRFMDIDAMGHVNHAKIISYFAEGRNEFLADMFDQFKPETFPFILKYVECYYINLIGLENQLTLEIWVKEIKNKSFTLGYKLVDKEKKDITYAQGGSVQICYDYNESRSIEISNKLRQKLLEYYIHNLDS